MNNNTNLLIDYDYVIIDTKYTSRIPSRINKKSQNPQDSNDKEKVTKVFNEIIGSKHNKKYNGINHLVCIVDKLWGKNSNDFILYGDMSDYNFVKSVIDIDGIILLKNINLTNVYNLINILNEKYKYCAFCSIDNIYELNLYETDNKTILHVNVDCESG
jgi:hypothetical protein